MSNTKELKKLMKRMGKVMDMNSSIKGIASLITDLDDLKNINSQPDKKEYMKSLVLLAIALGSETRCQEDIDKMYHSDEKKFFHYYNHTGIGKTKIFDKFSISTSEYVKKCYGIILAEEFEKESKGIPLFIQRLIKKAFKPVYSFNMHKKWDVIEEFIPYYEGKKGGVENISGVYIDRCCYILMYFSIKEGKTLFPSDMLRVVNGHFHYLTTQPNLKEITESELELTVGYKDLIEKTTFKNQISEDVSYFFENIRLIEERVLLGDNSEPHNLDQIREMLIKMPLTRITNALLVLMETFGLSGDFLREVKLGNERLEEIAKYIYMIKNYNGLTERDAEVLFLVALVIYGIATEYNNLRSEFYEGLKVKMQEKEVEEEKKEANLEAKHQKELAELQEKLRAANDTISSLKAVHKSKDETIKQFEKDQKRISAELEKAKENDKEVQFLREFFFNNQEEPKVSEDISMESITLYLKSVKGVIVGGHTNLTKKLKEVLPNFDFVAETETSRNLSFLRNTDIIFLSWVHDNHGLYEKVVKEINNTDTVLTYLEKHQNVDLLLRDMYEKTREKLL